MFQRESIQMPNASSKQTASTRTLQRTSEKLVPTSSKPRSPRRSNPPTPASSTITIRYICPHCSVVHTRSFRLSSSTKRKTFPPSIIKCSVTFQKVGLLQLGTKINQFTDFGAQPPTE